MLFGQGTTSTITGVISDPSGAVIPEAAVSILNQRTGVEFHLKTNSAGVYSITSLIPGTYTVKVEAKGFQAYLNRNLELTVNQVMRIDATLEVGAETQTVTVESAAPLVNTEEGRLSALVSGSQVQNMPLNGRNIYDLMQLVPGAVNSVTVMVEQTNGGSMTNINGARANFNGFLLDGVANKGLSGGSNAQPSPDFVQEFRIMTNDFSAQYGNSAGSVTDVSIKSGSNTLHGDAWEYLRNDKLNARNFFSDTRPEWRQNQFGATISGPIKKGKLFFFGGYEGERFRTGASQQYTVETPEFRQIIQSAFGGSNAVSALLYKDFPAPTPTTPLSTVTDIVTGTVENDLGATLYDGTNAATAAYGADASGNPAGLLITDNMGYTDPCFLNQFIAIGKPGYSGGPAWGNAQALANKFATLLGVTPAEQAQIQANISGVAGCSGFTAPAVGNGLLAPDLVMQGLANANVPTRTSGVFYNGDQFTGRLDYQGDKTRIFGRFIHFLKKDPNVTTATSQVRKFYVPGTFSFPSAAFGFVYNFTPTVVNEFRAGYTRNQLSYVPPAANFGVPTIGFDSGEAQFGAYNGYPQFFNENVYNYSDMVAIVKGKHSIKLGAEYKRNLENSEFNVGRASYYFFDSLWFAADAPYDQNNGINPELGTGAPAHLDTNIRAWRNYELGLYFQDDWKVTKNFTLNLGVRWDYFSPHTEKYNHATNFHFAPGADAVERLANVNCQAIVGGNCVLPTGDTQTPTGGFIGAARLFPPDKNNFSPRFGFAWDPRGNGKTSIRGGFAAFYESTLYNPLSNSRWNLPYYSFSEASPWYGVAALPVYGPTSATTGVPDTSVAPTYSGPPANIGNGPAGSGFTGNLMGWWPANPKLASLTGIPDPSMRTPYMENAFFGIQHELTPSTVLELNWVGTFGHKLFWAENINRVVGGKLRDPSTIPDPCTGGTASAATGAINPCFGRMRVWKNSVNSSYGGLQVSLNKKMTHGVMFTSNYTWSHSLDYRSSWQALSSGGAATETNPYGVAGYSMDPARIYLERGNSTFDVRHRWVTSLQWEFPWLKDQRGAVGKAFGGWRSNYIVTLQSGFPFTVGAHKDYNKDGISNDRPDIPSWGNHRSFNNQDFLLGSGPGGAGLLASLAGDFPTPTPGTDGTLGRNTFSGPGIAEFDFSLFKKIPINERFKLDFRAEFFNLFNRVNLYPPTANLIDSAFGLSQRALDPRVIQFGLKLNF